MNEMANYGDKRMTVREVAEAIGYEYETLRKKVKDLFPESVIHGKETLLSETQVFELKKNLFPRTPALKSGVDSALTALDIEEMTIKVISYHKSEADRLRAELLAVAPKIESFNALMRSDTTMSITDASKHFGLHPKTQVFPYLREKRLVTTLDIPTQYAIDMGLLVVRETILYDGTTRKQPVVMTCQLEKWRTYLVPRIMEWSK